MRLVVTVPWRELLGGAEIMLWRLLSHLDKDRFQTTVAFLEPGPFQDQVAALPGVRTVAVPTARLRDLRRTGAATRRLARVLHETRPDLVLNWVAKAQLYGAPAAAMAGVGDRVVWWQHGIPDGHWMDRLASALPARAVGCSSTTAAWAQARLAPHRPTFVVHPGVEPERAAPVSRQALGIADERAVVGIVGRLQPWKGQHRVIEAVGRLRDGGHDVHALVVGGDAHGLSPEYGQLLRSRIAELRLGDRVTLTGQVPDPSSYIAAMDVLVNASVREPFGMVVLEGMAQEVAVVAVGDAGPRDIIEHDLSGLLVAQPDASQLAAAVEGLLVDGERRRRVAAAGRERLLARFTARRMTERLQDVLEDLRP
jgi:glycosyltransferase involved in cell wall biosynthesis